MGIITMGVPKDAALFIKDNFNCNVFVETGTYYGDTTVWAAGNFDKVYTIEFSEEIFNSTSKKYADLTNINFSFGDTRDFLKDIVAQNKSKGHVFWLDAHWSSGITYGEDDQCPLLDELAILNQNDDDNYFILIDDARLFLCSPPSPHNLDQYPDIGEIITALQKKDRFIAVYDDVIFAIPAKHKVSFRAYLQSRVNTDLILSANTQAKKISLTRRIGRKIKAYLSKPGLK